MKVRSMSFFFIFQQTPCPLKSVAPQSFEWRSDVSRYVTNEIMLTIYAQVLLFNSNMIDFILNDIINDARTKMFFIFANHG